MTAVAESLVLHAESADIDRVVGELDDAWYGVSDQHRISNPETRLSTTRAADDGDTRPDCGIRLHGCGVRPVTLGQSRGIRTRWSTLIIQHFSVRGSSRAARSVEAAVTVTSC